MKSNEHAALRGNGGSWDKPQQGIHGYQVALLRSLDFSYQ